MELPFAAASVGMVCSDFFWGSLRMATLCFRWGPYRDRDVRWGGFCGWYTLSTYELSINKDLHHTSFSSLEIVQFLTIIYHPKPLSLLIVPLLLHHPQRPSLLAPLPFFFPLNLLILPNPGLLISRLPSIPLLISAVTYPRLSFDSSAC